MKPYIEVENLVRKLFKLQGNGKFDSQETKDIRVRMSQLFENLSDKNQERMMKLSIKLYQKHKSGLETRTGENLSEKANPLSSSGSIS